MRNSHAALCCQSPWGRWAAKGLYEIQNLAGPYLRFALCRHKTVRSGICFDFSRDEIGGSLLRRDSLGGAATMVGAHALEPCLSPGEANSARPSFVVRGPSTALAVAGRRANGWSGHGRYAIRSRYSLAPRRRRARQNPHSRALCLAAKETTGKRRREDRCVSRGPAKPFVD